MSSDLDSLVSDAVAQPDVPAPATPAPPAAAAPAAAVAVAPPQTPARVLPAFEVVDIEDEAVASKTEFDFFKGVKNKVERIAIPDLKSIGVARQHFIENAGSVLCRSEYQRQVTEGTDGRKIYSEVMVKKAGCCELMGESSKRFACPIVVFVTNPKGELVKPVDFAMKLWMFAPARFSVIQGIHKEFPLTKHDLKVSCTDVQYQKMDIQPHKDSMYALPAFQEKYGPTIAGWLQSIRPELKRAIGRDMNDAEIAKKLGEGTPASAVEVPTGPVASLGDLLS